MNKFPACSRNSQILSDNPGLRAIVGMRSSMPGSRPSLFAPRLVVRAAFGAGGAAMQLRGMKARIRNQSLRINAGGTLRKRQDGDFLDDAEVRLVSN